MVDDRVGNIEADAYEGATQNRRVLHGGAALDDAIAFHGRAFRQDGDGTRVSFVSANGTKISVYDTVLQAPSPLPGSTGASSAHPRMSPDGTHTAFVLDRNIWLSNCPYGELSVTKSADSTVIAGQSVTYTVVVNNAGPSVFNGVVLTDVLPAGVITLTVSPDQIDDDNTGLGFGGGTHSGTIWNAAEGALKINPTTWALPGGGTSTGWFSMTGNVLLLHLDEGAGAISFADASGQGNTGSCSSCPTAGVTGKVNAAAQFDGINNGINVAHNGNLNFATNQDFAIAVWVKIASVQSEASNDSNYILEKSNGSDAFPYTIRYFNANSGHAGQVLVGRFDNASPPNAQFPAIYSTRKLGDDQFHHIVFVRSSGMLLLYVDGVLDGTTPDTTVASTQNNDPLLIGQKFGNLNHLQGVIDEVAIFNRPLSSQEVVSIYSRQSPVYFGQFDSRIMGSGTITLPWTNLAWTPLQPQLKELPNNNRAELGYPAGGVNMTGTVLLMHLNEISGTTSFADTSGLNNNGSCSGAGCPTAGVSGRFNTALSFDGANDFVSLGSPASMNISGTISLEAWVNPRSTSGVQYILSHGDAAGPNPGVFLRINNGNYEVGVANRSLFSAVTAMPSTDVGNWVHIAGVFTGTHWIIYRNGAATSSLSTTVGAVSSGANWALGASSAAPSQYYQGSLDEVVVMNRALSSAEVLDHYRRGALHLKFQARSCSLPNCSDATFTGPDGTINTFYSELTAKLLSTPVVTFTPGLAPNPFFQYRAVLDTENPAYLPGVKLVRVSPPHSALQATQGDCFGTSVIICALGSIGANQSVTVTIIARVDPASRGSLVNNVIVSGDGVDRDQFNNAATRSTLITTRADLLVTKSASSDIVVPGRTLTYTMFITNVAGPSFADNTFLVDILPANVTVITFTQGCSQSGNRVNCTLGNLAPTTGISATVVVTVNSNMPAGLFTNTVTVNSDDPDPNSLNNVAVLATLARPEINLDIFKLADPFPAIAGQKLTYSLFVDNTGPSNATGVLVTDVLPFSVTFGSAGAGCSASGGIVTCTPFSLAAGAGRVITIAVPLSPTLPDFSIITNTAMVTGTEFDTDATNNFVVLQTPVRRNVDVAVSTSVTPSVIAGTSLTYTLTVVNNGPSQATGVLLTDTLPASTTLQSFGVCSNLGGAVACSIGTLDVGQSYSVTIGLFVDPAARGSLINTASVSSVEFDTALGNNQSVTNIPIKVKTDLRLSKSDWPRPGYGRHSPVLHAHDHQRWPIAGDQRHDHRLSANRRERGDAGVGLQRLRAERGEARLLRAGSQSERFGVDQPHGEGQSERTQPGDE